MHTLAANGIALAVISGTMNGLFTLPMRFLGRWAWENVWLLFILAACVGMPVAITLLLVPHPGIILASAPPFALGAAVLGGILWGCGSIMFGQTVSALGISLANTLVLAISSSLGSLLPWLLLKHAEMERNNLGLLLCAVAVDLIGILMVGRAGWLREHTGMTMAQRGAMVGHTRSLRAGLLLSLGAGFLSAVFNIGFTLARPIADTAASQGLDALAGQSLIWLIMLGSGTVANCIFCLILLVRNHSFSLFWQTGSARLYGLTGGMGLLWGGSIYVYGIAASRLGHDGVAIGWPVSLAVGLVTANLAGLKLGEWNGAARGARPWLYTGIVILLGAIMLFSMAQS